MGSEEIKRNEDAACLKGMQSSSLNAIIKKVTLIFSISTPPLVLFIPRKNKRADFMKRTNARNENMSHIFSRTFLLKIRDKFFTPFPLKIGLFIPHIFLPCVRPFLSSLSAAA